MKNRKRQSIVGTVNPLVMATGGMSGGCGDPMPPAIHGGLAMETTEGVAFKTNIPQDAIKDLLNATDIENSRFDIGQFEKYYGQDNINWCALFSENEECLSIAAIQMNHPFKGYGLPLLKHIVDEFGKVWLMANTATEDTLVDYYRDTELFQEIYIEDSVWECPAYFFCTDGCDYDKLEGYCYAFYANDDGDEEVQEFNESSVKKESSIDYPVSEGLCPEIWDTSVDGKFKIKPEIKQRALELVDKLLAKYHVEAKGVNVVGSICSNQYTDDGDVDIHIQVDLPEDVAEKLNNLRKKTQEQVLGDESNLMVGDSKTHPLEFYFQHNIYADMGSCGCYDLMNDEWLSGPQLVDMEFDPYEYESSWEEAFEFGKKAQEALFDLNKNLYKHNAILEQASNKDVYSNEQLMSVVGRRLEETKDQILDSMSAIYGIKEEMVQVRRRAGLKPQDKE